MCSREASMNIPIRFLDYDTFIKWAKVKSQNK
jgi:hypothetical protein